MMHNVLRVMISNNGHQNLPSMTNPGQTALSIAL